MKYLPYLPENPTGKWAICSKGRLGRITGLKELPWGLSWIGVGIDGTDWASREPHLLCEKDCEELDRLVAPYWNAGPDGL